MKLGKVAERRVKRPRAGEVVSPERETPEPNEFFDYERDVPAWIKRSVETKVQDTHPFILGDFSDLRFVRSVLGLDSAVNLDEVQSYVALYCEHTNIIDWVKARVKAGVNMDLLQNLRKLMDINARNALLPTPDERVRAFNEQARMILDPKGLDLAEKLHLNVLLDLLYYGYQLHPAQRAEYSRIARERLDHILDYFRTIYSDNIKDDEIATFYGVSKLVILLPETRETLRHFVGQLKEDWIIRAKQESLGSFGEVFPGLYCLMILAQDEVGMDEFGRLQFKKIQPTQKSPTLPIRPQV